MFDPWAIEAKRRKLTDTTYHEERSAEAETKQDWFAARFHLRRLVDRSPDDDELNERLRKEPKDKKLESVRHIQVQRVQLRNGQAVQDQQCPQATPEVSSRTRGAEKIEQISKCK